MPNILDQFSLQGKTALVTGASRGIGRSIAVGLAEAGANVALVARSDLSETPHHITSPNGALRYQHSPPGLPRSHPITRSERPTDIPRCERE